MEAVLQAAQNLARLGALRPSRFANIDVRWHDKLLSAGGATMSSWSTFAAFLAVAAVIVAIIGMAENISDQKFEPNHQGSPVSAESDHGRDVNIAAQKSGKDHEQERQKDSIWEKVVGHLFENPTEWIQVGINALLVLASVIAANAASKSSLAAFEAIRLTERQIALMEADERPWITAVAIDVGERGNYIQSRPFRIKLRNFGKLPPNAVMVYADIVPWDGWPAALDKFCENSREKLAREGWGMRFSVVPSTEPSFISTKPIDIKNLPQIKEPHIIGCIFYQLASDEIVRNSKFVSQLKITGEQITAVDVLTIDPK